MKKILGVFLAVMMLLVSASPAMAWIGCEVQRDWGTRYARLRVVCHNPETPVNIDETVQSDDGSATATTRIRIWGTGNVSVRVTSTTSTGN